jgi:hypothetical protein
MLCYSRDHAAAKRYHKVTSRYGLFRPKSLGCEFVKSGCDTLTMLDLVEEATIETSEITPTGHSVGVLKSTRPKKTSAVSVEQVGPV